MIQIEIRDERKLQILIESVLHEIAYTAELKAKCQEIGAGVSDLENRADHLRIILDSLTTHEQK